MLKWLEWSLKSKNNWVWTVIKWMSYVGLAIGILNLPLMKFFMVWFFICIFGIACHFERD